MKFTALVFGIMVAASAYNAGAQDRAADSAALLAIKEANPGSVLDTVNEVLWDNINGGQYTNAWKSGNCINRWKGVTVTNDRVNMLNLSDCAIRFVPIAPGSFSEVQTLKADRNGMTVFPDDIRNLKKLTSLSLFSNQFTTFPAGLDELHLKKVNLSNNKYAEIPQGMLSLTLLDTLDMTHNSIAVLPPELGLLVNLKVLSLGSNQLTAIPAEIGSLVYLRDLSLYHNQLRTLPKELKSLINLQKLSLGNNQFEALDSDVVGSLTALTYLELQNNKLSALPAGLENIPLLKTLLLNSNVLTSLPPQIGQLKRIENCYLDSNKLTTFPPEIGNMSFLSNLSADYNQIDSIPPELANASRLDYLSLKGNRLKTIPVNLNVNRRLYLQSNQLMYLPENTGTTDWTWNCSSMEEIYLQDNNLTTLPRNITRLNAINIPYCDFSKNYLTVDSLLPSVAAWLDTTDKDWKYTQKQTMPVRSSLRGFASTTARCRFDGPGILFTGGYFDGSIVNVLDINGKDVASGIVKKNRFAMETPAPRMAIVKVSGKNNATFRVISTP